MDTKYVQQALAEFNRDHFLTLYVKELGWMFDELKPAQQSSVLTRAQQLKEIDQHGN